MSILTRSVLKSFYETGDKPTQAQFSALIDSSLNLYDDHSLLGLRQYDSAYAYLTGDSVIYNGAIYICTTNTTGTFNPSDWNKIAGSVPGAVVYKGTWDADTNVPDLLTAPVAMGEYYVVSVAGNTNLDGITDWNVGDWAIYNGTAWEKVDNTDMVSDAENISSVGGAGIFKTKSGTILQFKKIQNNDGSLFITEDTTGNDFLDFGISFDDAGTSDMRAWSAQKIDTSLNTKTDKVSGATPDNFSSLDGTGNLLDSGYSGSSFLPSTTEAVNIPVTPAGNITAVDVQAALEELDTIKEAANPNIQAHIADMDNPHNTTKELVGLGNVTNDKQLSLKAYQESEAEQTTTVVFPTYTVALSVDFTPASAGDYLVEWYFEMGKNASAVTTVAGGVTVDGSPISVIKPRFTTDNQFTGFSGFRQVTLTAALHTIEVSFARVTGTSGDALIRRVRVKITQV